MCTLILDNKQPSPAYVNNWAHRTRNLICSLLIIIFPYIAKHTGTPSHLHTPTTMRVHTHTHTTHVCYTKAKKHKHTITQALSANILSYDMNVHQHCVILCNGMASLVQHLFVSIHAMVTMLFDDHDNMLLAVGNSMLPFH